MTVIAKINKLYRTKVKPFASLIIALIVLVAYFYYALVSHRTPTGDEPHYVLATISLIKDHDLNLLIICLIWTWKGLLFRISYLENHELVGVVIFIFLIFTIAVNQLLIYNKKIGFKQ
ncbi:hypothetical protein [Coleofasciculus sp.]|uniref:hypothetical protein n=1 Tax=Coleofasciculus sp. TaxID=3100458 RepID=UPI0039F88C25